MRARTIVRATLVAASFAALAAGCGSTPAIGPSGADASSDRDSSTGAAEVDAPPAAPEVGGGDVPPAALDVGGDVPPASLDVGGGEVAPAGPVDRSWIYVATDKGVQRVKAAGGTLEPFGIAAATSAVYPSPDGQLVAQELADQRVAVFAGDGTPRATFDIRPGLLGWSDETTLLFLDRQTMYLQQTSADGATRRYLPLPAPIQGYGYKTAILSPDCGLIAVLVEPYARDNVFGSFFLVISAVDGTVVRDFGIAPPNGTGPVWLGDGRILSTRSGQGLVLTDPRTGSTAPVPALPALTMPCGVGSWYEPGKILAGKYVPTPGSDTAMCVRQVLDVLTGTATDLSGAGAFSSPAVAFALSADGREAAVAIGSSLEIGPVAGGPRRNLGLVQGVLAGVAWAHPTGGKAKLVAPTRPPETAPGLAGAPPAASRSGGSDCQTGRWVNRTPNPVPAGWPQSRIDFVFAFDTQRGALLVEGGLAGNLGTLPNVDYETMEWSGADGKWTNLSRPDGFGPVNGRAIAYDGNHKAVLALGIGEQLFDGPWKWTSATGWKNLRDPSFAGERPWRLAGAASVYDLGRDRWIVSGGGIETATWEWDGAVWKKSDAPPPGGTTQLYGARLVYDTKRARVYLVGNRDRGSAPWLYEPAQNRWTAQQSTGASPLPRDWSGVAYDARRDRVMVFGGYAAGTSSPIVGGLSEWDPATGAWQTCASTGAVPGPRMNVALAYDPVRDVLVLYGGDLADGSRATDLWEWYVP